MKNTKLAFSLLPFFSFMNIDPGWAMMSSEVLKTIPRIVVKQRLQQTPMIRKRSLHTQGYKPEDSIPEFQFDNITQEKIKFTDKSHERYRSEVPDPSFKNRIAIGEQINDHTLLVNIKEIKGDIPPPKAQEELNNDKSSPNMQVQTAHEQLKTKGYRPENPIKAEKWHTLNLPKKVEWVDGSYEIFITPEGFQEMLEKSLSGRDRNKILDTPVISKKMPESYDLPANFFIENRKGIILDRVNGRIFHAHRDIKMEKESSVDIDSEEESENEQFVFSKKADRKSIDRRSRAEDL